MEKCKIGIRAKVSILVFAVVITMALAGMGAGYYVSKNFLTSAIGNENVKLANLVAINVSNLLESTMRDITTHLTEPMYVDAVVEKAESHKGKDEDRIKEEYLRLDKKWIDAPSDSSVTEPYLTGPVAEELREYVQLNKTFAEVFITDKWGGLVASSGRTSDFFQADEDWWQKAYNKGEGAYFVGDVEFDKSSGVMSVPLSFPIKDKKGTVVGVAKVVADAEFLFKPVSDFHIGETGHAVLVDQNGLIISHEGKEALRDRVLDEEKFKDFLNNPGHFEIIQKPHDNKTSGFMAFSKVEHPIFSEKVAWGIFIDQDTEEIFILIDRLFSQMLIISSILLLVFLPIVFVCVSRLISPITKLREGVERFGDGELDYKLNIKTGDELEDLSNSFNQMTLNLQEKIIAIKNLDYKIAERKTLEAKLRALNKFNQAMINTLPFAMDIVDEEGNILYLNPILKKICGNRKNQKCWQLYRDNQTQCEQCPLKNEISLDKVKILEVSGVMNGKTFQIYHVGMMFENKKALLEIFIDVTSRRQAEAALRQSEEKYRALFESSRDAIMTLEPPNWLFTAGNFSTLAMFKVKNEAEFISTTPYQLSPEYQADGKLSKEKALKMIHLAMEKGSHFFEWTHKKITGEEFFATVLLTKMSWEGKEFLQATVRDITETKKARVALERSNAELRIAETKLTKALEKEMKTREVLTSMLEDNNLVRERLEEKLQELKQAQAMLIQSEKLSSLGKLVSNIAHEVNNPLMIISGNAQVSLMEDIKDENIENNLKIIADQCSRAKSIIERLLKFSKPSKGEIVALDVNESADFSVKLLEHQYSLANVKILRKYASDLPKALFDEKQLHEVLVNLIKNAAEAMPGGGTITVSTSAQADKVKINIMDTGGGISENDMKNLFVPFFTTKEKGTGLGLPVCYGIMKAHGGDIKYKSKLGEGTTASLWLPIAK